MAVRRTVALLATFILVANQFYWLDFSFLNSVTDGKMSGHLPEFPCNCRCAARIASSPVV